MDRGTFVDVEKEKAEHENIKKNISKLKLRRMKKELHEADDVELFLSEMLINFRNRLLSIPSKVALQLIGEDDVNRIIEVLQKEMIETLDELSEYDPDKVNGEKNKIDDNEDDEE